MQHILFISDTHNKHLQLNLNFDIKNVDTIIHCGDISSMGHVWEVEDFLKWFSNLPVQNKIFIAGNHDFLFEQQRGLAQELLKQYPDVIYLEHSEVVIDGVKIFGSPYTPWFHSWAFNVYRGDALKKYWSQIPADTDILITHGPALGILDTLEDGDEVGCEDLLYRIEEVKPKIFSCGHIHNAYGNYQGINTLFINAAVLNEQYQMQNAPVLVDYTNLAVK